MSDLEGAVWCPSCQIIAHYIERKPAANADVYHHVIIGDTGLSADHKTCGECGANLERRP